MDRRRRGARFFRSARRGMSCVRDAWWLALGTAGMAINGRWQAMDGFDALTAQQRRPAAISTMRMGSMPHRLFVNAGATSQHGRSPRSGCRRPMMMTKAVVGGSGFGWWRRTGSGGCHRQRLRMVWKAILPARWRVATALLREQMPDGVLDCAATLGRASDPCRRPECGRHPERRSGSVHASHSERSAPGRIGPSSAADPARSPSRGKRLHISGSDRGGDGAGDRDAATCLSTEDLRVLCFGGAVRVQRTPRSALEPFSFPSCRSIINFGAASM